MEIGGLTLSNNVFLAPMAGVTDKAAREIAKPFGPALMYTEMVSAKALSFNNEKTKLMLDISPAEKPVAVQLFGHEPKTLAEIAEKLGESGAALIDINMGCPAPKIVKNGDGAALMNNPALAGEIVKEVCRASALPVTVKIRKGFEEKSQNAVEIAKIAEENGAAAVCVHPRTRQQFYSGKADLAVIKAVKKAVTIPVIGNGDIISGESAKFMLDTTGCDAVMIGRGAQGNPWIFKEVLSFLETGKKPEPPSLEERKKVMLKHLDLLCLYKGPHQGVLEARKHMAWYVKGIKGGAKIRQEIFTASEKKEMEDIILNLADKS